MTCEILTEQEEGQVLMCTLHLDDGQFSGQANQGFESVLQNVLDMDCMDSDGSVVRFGEDPERWMKLLPQNLCSTYTHARLVV